MPDFNPDVLKSISILNENGHGAYIVGGAVRDYFLGCEIHDFDVVCDAKIEEIYEIFKDYKSKIYANNQCVSIKIGESRIEVAPIKGGSIEDDLTYRDYSINSVAYAPELGFIDPYNGIADLNNHILRTIREPSEVFKKDPLRILRGIRFAITKGLEIPANLKAQFNQYAYLLDTVHPMRIGPELNAIMLSEKPSIYFYEYLDVFKRIIPELEKCVGFDQKSKWHSHTVFDHLMVVLDSTEDDLALRFAALFHDIKKPECFITDDMGVGHFPNHYLVGANYAKELLIKYAYPTSLIEEVYRLVKYHDFRLENATDYDIIGFLSEFGTRDIDKLMKLQKADIKGQSPDLLYRVEKYSLIENKVHNVISKYKIYDYQKLAIKMKDLIDSGYSEINAKRKLIKLASDIAIGKIKNEREYLKRYIRLREAN
ncbi:MAG: HD domain-containing protein [Acholeplasmatales bacterium]|nr:HD domain-containing protein [Acholeplasmatales bacterium]